MRERVPTFHDGNKIHFVNVDRIDQVVARNVKLLLDRSHVGLVKYGCGLDNSNLSLKQFLQHALEEALDKANYLQAAIMELEKQETNEQI